MAVMPRSVCRESGGGPIEEDGLARAREAGDDGETEKISNFLAVHWHWNQFRISIVLYS